MILEDELNKESEEDNSFKSDETQEPEQVLSEELTSGPLRDEKRAEFTLFRDFLNQFEQEPSVEGKIHMSIDFMRASLASSGTPRFKDFWEGRKLCLPLFKENIPAKVRSQLWSSYIELSSEAKRLKEILDEQSAFAIEQMELAIQGLERDLENYELLIAQAKQHALANACETLQEKKEVYHAIQQELNLLNTMAARINAMRKEVVKTEMRIRIKNKLLERLSHCGDKVFPKRKELIRTISLEFIKDVNHFVELTSREEELEKLPIYAVREEIKQLQSFAKQLTLNTQAFTETRLKLSECWDKIKEREKEKKKYDSEKRVVFKQNFDLVMQKIQPFAEACASEISREDCERQSFEILEYMKTLELGRDEVRALKDEIFRAKRAPLEREREKELARQNRHLQEEKERREAVQSLKEQLNALILEMGTMEGEALSAQRDALISAIDAKTSVKAERQQFDRGLKLLKDAIEEKKEKALLNLSESDLEALDQLRSILGERKQKRTEIKNQLEQYRKLLGGSGFDFEKAMMYRELIEEEKMRLEKVNSSVGEIEEKIDEIEER